MQETLRTLRAAAAIAVLLAPALAYAAAEAPSAVLAQPAAPSISSKPASIDAPLKAVKPAEEYKETDVWGRIRTGFAIPDIDNELVAKHVSWYATRPDYLLRTSARASRYLFHVVTELEKRNMPTELALLPIIESAFNPQANSTANAAGMWQFVPGTGRDFNLKQNTFKDERRGVLASTDAALSYLQKLYGMFGDWQLALAAYNWGEGNVAKAIKRNQAAGKPTDYESLCELMPAETRNYVPKLQAVKNIVANPAQYNVALPVIDNQPYFTAVDKTSDIDVAVAAQLAELSIDEFKALNPQFKRPVITGDEQTKILLPTENAEKFNLNLAQWGRALTSWTTHKIASAKESIVSLASKFGTTPEALRQANNIPAKSHLIAGSTILVPRAQAAPAGNDIIESAVMAFEADREGKRSTKLTGAARFKAKAAGAVADIKSHVARTAAHHGAKALVAEPKSSRSKKRG